jgi:hypothetical protein
MPIDPAHGRNIPTGYRFEQVVNAFLRRSRQRFFDMLRQGYMPEFEPMDLTALVESLVPLYEQQYTAGARFSFNQIRTLDPRFIRATPEAMARLRQASKPPSPPRASIAVTVQPMPPMPTLGLDLSRAFTLLQPTVEPAARRLAVNLAGEITQTTRERVRDAIREGILAGEPLSRTQARIMGIQGETTVAERVEQLPVFGKKRAGVIAQTEVSRAMHAGQADYGKSVGAWGMEWLASSDACELCLSLSGKQVPYGEPFYVWPKANPEYKFVWYPPAHPNCRCTAIDVFK